MRLGERIRIARERKGLTQAELAQEVGVARETVGNWETGQTSPRNKLTKLEEALSVQLAKRNGEGDSKPRYRLGLDVGVDSIGWAVVQIPDEATEGLTEPELEELKAELNARAWSKAAEIKARQGRVVAAGVTKLEDPQATADAAIERDGLDLAARDKQD